MGDFLIFLDDNPYFSQKSILLRIIEKLLQTPRLTRLTRLCNLGPRNKALFGLFGSYPYHVKAHEQPPQLVLDPLAQLSTQWLGTHQETMLSTEFDI